MPRNLDITALRSFVAVADAGGVTRAAGFLNLTQSAVSMQLKRLEELLGLPLFDRSGRTIALTTTGEHLLRDARRILALNDEIWNRMTDPVHEGEIRLGVPHDIVYPAIPQILQKFHAEFPRVRVNLVSSFTANLLQMHERGECEIVLTTEQDLRPGGETLLSLPLVWIGAPGGAAWRSRPLRLGFEQRCGFRPGVLAALDRAGIEWEMAVEFRQQPQRRGHRQRGYRGACGAEGHGIAAGRGDPPWRRASRPADMADQLLCVGDGADGAAGPASGNRARRVRRGPRA